MNVISRDNLTFGPGWCVTDVTHTPLRGVSRNVTPVRRGGHADLGQTWYGGSAGQMDADNVTSVFCHVMSRDNEEDGMVAWKAIETRYKGYRFRSRTEARYAVLFDALGIEWEYERQGFDLDGVWYLPDFWLKTVGMWAEVKGDAFTSDERALCEALVLATEKPCILLAGTPTYRPYEFLSRCNNPESPCDYTGAHPHVVSDELLIDDWKLHEGRFYVAYGAAMDPGTPPAAYDRARGARFEHGEDGTNRRVIEPKPITRVVYEAGDIVEHPRYGTGIVKRAWQMYLIVTMGDGTVRAFPRNWTGQADGWRRSNA